MNYIFENIAEEIRARLSTLVEAVAKTSSKLEEARFSAVFRLVIGRSRAM